MKEGFLPNLARFQKGGLFCWADGVIPTFTNPNNLSIVTGSPPSVHGISGNFFLDPETGFAVMMNDPRFLRSETILAKFARAGVKVGVITAKHKLLSLLSHNLAGGIRFSAERADRCNQRENGIEGIVSRVGMGLPDIYSADISLFVLRAAAEILARETPPLMYLSLTDYIQHKYAPGTKEADEFYRLLDLEFGRLEELGALIALTADHGMNDKASPEGSPKVIYLQDLLDREFGGGLCRVICPITDPYVIHHGSLGSFVTVYCSEPRARLAVMEYIRGLEGIDMVFNRKAGLEDFELPPDRIGDVSVLGDSATVIGTTPREHDLSALGSGRLRSHGGRAEQRVPFVLSRPLQEPYASRALSDPLRNFDIFDFALNGAF